MSPSTINIAVLHADAAARESLCDFIDDQVGFRVVGGGAIASQLAALQRAAPVHVLVVHHAGPAGETLDAITAARALLPGAGVIVLLAAQAEALPADKVPPGAACLHEERVPAELVGALRTIAMGRRYIPA
jgi:DNA-binding NarL/FixJ family response regulator